MAAVNTFMLTHPREYAAIIPLAGVRCCRNERVGTECLRTIRRYSYTKYRRRGTPRAGVAGQKNPGFAVSQGRGASPRFGAIRKRKPRQQHILCSSFQFQSHTCSQLQYRTDGCNSFIPQPQHFFSVSRYGTHFKPTTIHLSLRILHNCPPWLANSSSEATGRC